VPPYQGAPGFLGQGRLADTLERLQSAGLRDFYAGDVARELSADMAEMGGFVTEADLASCEARVVPALEAACRGRRLMLARGLTAAPTLVRLLQRMEAAPFSGAPDAAWYAHLAQAMRDPTPSACPAWRGRAAGRGQLHHPPDRRRPRRHDGGDDHDAAVLHGQPHGAAAHGVLMNNGRDVVRPHAGQRQRHRARQAPAVQHVPVIALDAEGVPQIALGASGGRRIMAAVYQMLAM
jgi:gamma-glutamyltranspeptidase/glutathione hydrolase